MLKLLPVFSIVFLLQACEMTEPQPYQADRAPEDRTEYNGLKGVVQQQKDQNYLMTKELSDKCNAAKVDLAVAKSQGDDSKIEVYQTIINNACR